MAGFIDKLLGQFVGEKEVAAAKGRQDQGISRYFFDKGTEQAVVVDWRDHRPGDKQFHWEQRGVPFRIEVGPRDVDGAAFVLKKRLDRSKEVVQLATADAAWLTAQLDAAQKAMFEKARAHRDANIRTASSYEEMKRY